MKPALTWSYAPYCPPFHDAGDIYICRIAPGANDIHFEWLGDGGAYRVLWRKEGETAFSTTDTIGNEYTVTNLDADTDYEIMVEREDQKSRIRLARTGETVGTVVNYLHPRDDAYAFSGHYLCSPSMVRHPDGYLLASMDVYAGGMPQNLELIFRSDDNGTTWHYVTELYPCFWGRLFIHLGNVYMIGCSTEYGDLLIGKSTDGGNTFEPPTVLLRGSCKCNVPGIHKNPQPPLEYNGKLYHTMEWGSWGAGFHAAMIGAHPTDADPIDASVWEFSDPVKYDPTWEGVAEGPSNGNIEGTLAVLPDGKLYNIMRYDMMRCTPDYGLVLAYRVNTDRVLALSYDHAISFPGNHSKFTIRQDPVTGLYYTILCRILDSEHKGARTLISLMCSADCKHWELVCDLIDKRNEDMKMVGFQYIDFFFEGEDLLWLCRTAMNDAHNFHDSNYSTFHRTANFRNL